MLGKGAPKIVAWERQKAPYAAFGLLRFKAGRLDTSATTFEELEGAAIIDIQNQIVLGLTLNKKGSKAAAWSWEDNRLVVASAEGLSEEFLLKGIKAGSGLSAAAAAAAADKSAPRREASAGASQSGPKSSGQPAWSPWSKDNGSKLPRLTTSLARLAETEIVVRNAVW